jgi:hypothetical protein
MKKRPDIRRRYFCSIDVRESVVSACYLFVSRETTSLAPGTRLAIKNNFANKNTGDDHLLPKRHLTDITTEVRAQMLQGPLRRPTEATSWPLKKTLVEPSKP